MFGEKKTKSIILIIIAIDILFIFGAYYSYKTIYLPKLSRSGEYTCILSIKTRINDAVKILNSNGHFHSIDESRYLSKVEKDKVFEYIKIKGADCKNYSELMEGMDLNGKEVKLQVKKSKSGKIAVNTESYPTNYRYK